MRLEIDTASQMRALSRYQVSSWRREGSVAYRLSTNRDVTQASYFQDGSVMLSMWPPRKTDE